MADTTKKKKIDANEVIAVGESDIALNDTANAVTASTNKATDWQAQSDAYSKQADTYLENYAKNGDFSYDFNVDPVFQAAKQAYERSGKLAAEDVQGRAAALSGGYSNSYGATAAQQAYNQSIDNLYDTIPELEAAAYNRYQNEQQKNLTLHEAYQNKADSAENKANNAENKAYTYASHLAQLGQYDKLGEFLGVDLSAVQQDEEMQKALELALTTGDLSQLEKYGINTEYLNRSLNSEWAQLQAQFGDYSGLENLGVDTTDYQNEKAQEKALNDALQRAQFGDYSGLKALGYDMSTQEQKEALNLAMQKAELGDYSGLKKLGIDTSYLERQVSVDNAVLQAQYGDYSGLKKLGIDTSSVETANNLNTALQLAQVGDYAPLEALGYDTKKLKDNDLLSWAQVAAEAGDYSLYKELGIDTSALEYERDFTNALQMAQVGDYSGLKKLGINTSALTTKSSGSGAYKKTDDTPKVDVSSIAKNIKSAFLGDYEGAYATGDVKNEEIRSFESVLAQVADKEENIDTDTVDKVLLQAGIPADRIDALWDYYNKKINNNSSGNNNSPGDTKPIVKKKSPEQIAEENRIASTLGYDTDSARKEKFMR